MITLETPNYNDRKSDIIDMIVLHYTGTKTLNDAITRLCRKKYEVSAHYLIAKNGDIYQMVPEEYRAWHAGVSFWKEETDINSRSIGIEIENTGHDHDFEEYPDTQIASLVGLCKNLIEKYDIKPINIVAHSDIAPSRKKDPGEKFPWQLLAENEIGFFPKPSNMEQIPPDFDYIKALNYIGYDISTREDTIAAFIRRYAPNETRNELSKETKGKIYTLYQFVKEMNSSK